MALYAFDGTWNQAKDSEDTRYQNTNVVRFYRAYHARSGTDDFYVAGVGTRFDLLGKVLGGVFGLGVLPRINEAYDHLCRQWADGDRVIDVVGFSRGAATTLDFCHKVLSDGVRQPGSDTVVEPQPLIRFLGVWDVVAAFGLANLGNTALNIGHHLTMPKQNVRYCFHAMALDERRPSFLPIRLNGAYEVWFRGVHSDIGGGNGNRGLNDIALRWMLSKAKAAGLPVVDADVAELQPDPAAAPHFDPKLPVPVRIISAVDRRHYTVSEVDGCTNPPVSCPVETQDVEQQARELGGPVEVLPLDLQRRVNALWETAKAVAARQDFDIEPVRDPFVSLLQSRVVLVTNDGDELRQAAEAVARLTNLMVRGAKTRNFHVMNEFFLNEALFEMPRVYPLTN